MVCIQIVRENISINFVVDDDKTGDDGETNPVTEDVEAAKDFFYATVSVAHFHFEALLPVLSYEVAVNNKQQPALEKHYRYRELDTEQQCLFIVISFSFKGSMLL